MDRLRQPRTGRGRIPTHGVRTAVYLCVIVAGAGLAPSCSKQSPAEEGSKPGAGKAVPVTAASVVRKAMPIELKTVGTAQAYATVAIRSQVTEVLQTVHFRKGQDVRKGDLLFTIAPRPFEVAMDQARANLGRDIVQAENAQKLAEHEAVLLKKGISSQDEYDKARTNAEALAAGVLADIAAVENAELQLKYCSIRSPVDGRVGNLLVDEGNLVKANDVVLVIINQIHPIEVSFCVPQSDLPGIRRYMARGKLAVRALVPKEESDGEDGELTFVDNAVEKGTGTVQLRATFQNPRERLWPGLYVQVILTLAVQDDAIVAASRAIQTGRDGKYVFVVKSDGTVEMRGVKVSRAVGRETVVDEGLQAGERVVTDGHLRLIDGTKVEVQGEAKTQPASQRTGV